MRVFVYWNFNKKLWSIRSMDTGKVVDWKPELCLSNCILKVSQSGRKRVLRDKRKNVHAGVIGCLIKNTHNPKTLIGYNPYKYKTFINKTNLAPIESASIVCFKKDGSCRAKGLK